MPGLWGHFNDKVVDVPVVTRFQVLIFSTISLYLAAAELPVRTRKCLDYFYELVSASHRVRQFTEVV